MAKSILEKAKEISSKLETENRDRELREYKKLEESKDREITKLELRIEKLEIENKELKGKVLVQTDFTSEFLQKLTEDEVLIEESDFKKLLKSNPDKVEIIQAHLQFFASLLQIKAPKTINTQEYEEGALTQSELADRAGITVAGVSSWLKKNGYFNKGTKKYSKEIVDKFFERYSKETSETEATPTESKKGKAQQTKIEGLS